MIISKKLTAEELDEIANSPIVCDEDCPELTPAHFTNLKPAHSEHSDYWRIESVKIPLHLHVDADIVAWFKSGGRDYQKRMNSALREVMQKKRAFGEPT
ncbi:hypothetical protein FACS1894200_03110 [Spirochaetia bacterium]|nr:hypothetical protein FACS1894200_03110 [Spirochaetia bacterium]